MAKVTITIWDENDGPRIRFDYSDENARTYANEMARAMQAEIEREANWEGGKVGGRESWRGIMLAVEVAERKIREGLVALTVRPKGDEMVTKCKRCGKPCLPGKSKNPEARPFRRAEKGFCEDCAVTRFLMSVEPLRMGLLRNGIEVLKNPNIQKQFATMLKVGGSELPFERINWDTVIAQWDMPFPKRA